MYSYMAYNLLVFEFIWMNKFKFDIVFPTFYYLFAKKKKKELALIV